MGQPPDGLILLPVKVAMLPPLTMASGLTFSKQLLRIVVPEPALLWAKMPAV